MPTSATSRGTSRPAARSALSAPSASRSLAQKIASGVVRGEQALDGLASRLDHEVVRDLDQRVVARRARSPAAASR